MIMDKLVEIADRGPIYNFLISMAPALIINLLLWIAILIFG